MKYIQELEDNILQDDEDEDLSELFYQSLVLHSKPAPRLASEVNQTIDELYHRIKTKSFKVQDLAKAYELRIMLGSDLSNEKARYLGLAQLEIQFRLSLVQNSMVTNFEVLIRNYQKTKFNFKKIQQLSLGSFFNVYRNLRFNQCLEITLVMLTNAIPFAKEISETSLFSKNYITKLLAFSLMLDLSDPETKGGIVLSRVYATAITQHPVCLLNFSVFASFFDSLNGQVFDEKLFKDVRTFIDKEISACQVKSISDRRLTMLFAFIDSFKNKKGVTREVVEAISQKETKKSFKQFVGRVLGNKVSSSAQ
jgi:hypothetical protein